MKTLNFYISGEQIDQLTERYGSELELLDRPQKLQLRVILNYFILGREMMGNDYGIQDAVEDLNYWQLFVTDEKIQNALNILKGITIQDAESLLEALQNQCRTGNARLKTAVESTTTQLIDLGVPLSLAKTSAKIIHEIDNQRPRTEDEQALINQVHKILVRGGKS